MQYVLQTFLNISLDFSPQTLKVLNYKDMIWNTHNTASVNQHLTN